MAETTKIQWTDHTFNPWRGCKRNPKTLGIWGDNGTRVVAAEAGWREVEKWNKAAGETNRRKLSDSMQNRDSLKRPRVFVASLADVFEAWDAPMVDSHGERLWFNPALSYWVREDDRDQHTDDDDVDTQSLWRPLTMNDVRARLFRLIDDCPNLDFLLLTKRPQNIRSMWVEPTNNALDPYPWMRRNVWLITSIACQEDADRNIPHLLQCRDLVPVLGVSAEPLIEEIDLLIDGECSDWQCPNCLSREIEADIPTNEGNCWYCHSCNTGAMNDAQAPLWASYISWVIAGGESGHGARPCNIAWIRSLRDQCKAADVACFVKQLGAKPYKCIGGHDRAAAAGPGPSPDCRGNACERQPNLSDPKGGDWDEWPKDLQVREFPQ